MTIDELLKKARIAQSQIEFWPQNKVDLMVASAGWETYKPENAKKIARLAVEETEMGLYEHKLLKHQKKTLGVLRDLQGVKLVARAYETIGNGLMLFLRKREHAILKKRATRDSTPCGYSNSLKTKSGRRDSNSRMVAWEA